MWRQEDDEAAAHVLMEPAKAGGSGHLGAIWGKTGIAHGWYDKDLVSRSSTHSPRPRGLDKLQTACYHLDSTSPRLVLRTQVLGLTSLSAHPLSEQRRSRPRGAPGGTQPGYCAERVQHQLFWGCPSGQSCASRHEEEATGTHRGGQQCYGAPG